VKPVSRETPSGIRVGPGLVLPESEIHTRAVRSGGPGGQAVNKVSSKVVLRFSVARSAVLDADQKARLLARLRSRVTREGDLVIHASAERERLRNEKQARDRLARLIAAALEPEKPRVKTRPSGSSRRRRLESKRRRGDVKRGRRSAGDE
jgi:ribosome-associated protein